MDPLSPRKPIAAIYCRVSTSGQEDGTSLDTQVSLNRESAESQGFAVSEEFIYRETWSGADIERPELTRLRNDVKANKVHAVFVHHLDRWSRNPLHALMLVEELQSAGVQLHFVNGTLEDTPEGHLILYVQGFAGQHERERFIERTKLGKDAVARSGRLPTGTGAGLFGYDYNKDTKTRTINEEEANVVRMVFKWASEGNSFFQIAVKLNDLNLPTKKGCKWQPLTIRRLLENRAYTGIQFYGENRYRKVKGGKREVTPRPSSEVILIEGFSPPIIFQELFDLVQSRLTFRQARMTKSQHRYLLTGYAKCMSCGSPVVGACMQKRYRYYRCRATVPTSTKPASCQARYIPAEALEQYVFRKVTEVVLNPSVLVAELNDFLSQGAGDTSREIGRLKREISKLESQQIRLIQQRGRDQIDQGILERQIAPVKALYDETWRSLHSLQEQQRISDDAVDVERRIVGLCQHLATKLHSLDFNGQRALLGTFGVHVETTRDEVSLTVVLDPKFTTIEQTSA